MTVTNVQEEVDKGRAGAAALIPGVLAVGLSFVGGLAAGRISYEGLFPALLWLGRPLPGLLTAAVVSLVGWLLWRRLARSLFTPGVSRKPNDWPAAAWSALLPFLPLLLNLAYLFDPAVNLQRSRMLFLASLWLAAIFLAWLLAPPARWRWLSYVLILAFLFPVYLATMGRTVGRADTFEFQVVAPQLGIVHPTGYPLYLLLAKPFAWLPFNDVAWRVNLATVLFGLVAVCLLYTLVSRLTGRILPALLASVIFGLTPTFWSQSVEAEVYSLHAAIVIAALLLMRELGDWRLPVRGPDSSDDRPRNLQPFTATVLLSLTLGLGLANHLTTIILLPAAALAIFMAYRQGRYRTLRLGLIWSVLVVVAAFTLPLLLYAYLPIRWQAVNGEAMGFQRFIDWVIGGRFQGALQLDAWLSDSARYEIVGRLMANEWPVAWGLLLVLIGLAYLFFHQWRYASLLAITWLGYAFYGLNYYVPDLTVFLIPAFLIMAIFWAVGLVALMRLVARLLVGQGAHFTTLLQALIALLVVFPGLAIASQQTWPTVDRSADDGRTLWARSVLDLPIPGGAAILADSDKFPPLYYLQQAEGLRPDLDILVLPDEGAYRAELDARLAAGQPVYLARFLPGLEGIYHLRSLGPLTEVGVTAERALPPAVDLAEASFGPIDLLGYQFSPSSPFAEGEAALTLYWTTAEPLDEVLYVYTRWAGETFAGPATGQHPAGNTYPTVAWQVGEVVADFHGLPLPGVVGSGPIALQVALAPPFTPVEELPWSTIATLDWPGPAPAAALDALRMQLGPLQVDGLLVNEPARSDASLSVLLSGYASAPESILLAMLPAGSDPDDGDWQIANPLTAPADVSADDQQRRLRWAGQLDARLLAGDYDLLARYEGQEATCVWLARRTDSCLLGQLELTSQQLPPGAVNFEDKIAMRSIDIPETSLRSGGELPLTVTWQSLAPLGEDFTVFIQVLDDNDRIVGQVDAWPLQGTYPTSQWSAGEIVEDPYRIPLAENLAPGQYKLYIGWYLLETLRRLPVINMDGLAVDDKVIVPGLTASD